MSNEIAYQEPWYSVADSEIGTKLSAQLIKEIGIKHPLHTKKFKTVARRHDRDDLLVELDNDNNRFAVVHLTYAPTPAEDGSWPKVEFYKTAEDFTVKRLLPDIQEFK